MDPSEFQTDTMRQVWDVFIYNEYPNDCDGAYSKVRDITPDLCVELFLTWVGYVTKGEYSSEVMLPIHEPFKQDIVDRWTHTDMFISGVNPRQLFHYILDGKEPNATKVVKRRSMALEKPVSPKHDENSGVTPEKSHDTSGSQPGLCPCPDTTPVFVSSVVCNTHHQATSGYLRKTSRSPTTSCAEKIFKSPSSPPTGVT